MHYARMYRRCFSEISGDASIDPVPQWGVSFGMDYRERITIEPGNEAESLAFEAYGSPSTTSLSTSPQA